MGDPLALLQARSLREQLERLRSSYGTFASSKELRGWLQGFRGQKGIYKPSGARHALWVRQTLRGTYPDEDLSPRPDGSWTYRYAAEGRKGRSDPSLDTNRALVQCMEDGIPVGVLRQRDIGDKGRGYEILGLAFVQQFDGDHFLLQGEPMDWQRPAMTQADSPFVALEPKRHESAQLRVVRDQRFGVAVRYAYRERCAACNVGYRLRGSPLGLEAAHVIPVASRGTSVDVRNGVLLCRNHHSLFDGFAWTFDEDFRVVVADDPSFRESAVENHILQLEDRRLPNLPADRMNWPAPEAIRHRLREFEAAQS